MREHVGLDLFFDCSGGLAAGVSKGSDGWFPCRRRGEQQEHENRAISKEMLGDESGVEEGWVSHLGSVVDVSVTIFFSWRSQLMG